MQGILDALINPAELDHAAVVVDKSTSTAASATNPPPARETAATDEGDAIAEVFQYPSMKDK